MTHITAVAGKVTGVSAAGTVTLAATLDMHLLGYTVDQWQIIGIITGIVMGIAGLVVTVTFQYLNYRLQLKKGAD